MSSPGLGKGLERAFVAQPAPLREMRGVETLAPEKSPDFTRLQGEAVGLCSSTEKLTTLITEKLTTRDHTLI